jgi:hypothetical protein
MTASIGSLGTREGFFFEKRSKKLSIFGGTGVETGTDQSEQCFFASFLFTKKKILPVSQRPAIDASRDDRVSPRGRYA